jgi:hypothetical protein
MRTKEVKKVAPPIEVPNEISLLEKQVNELAEVNRKAVLIKVELGDISIQIEQLANRRRLGIDEVRKVEQEYATKVHKFATALGIEVDADPQQTGERWEFNPQAASFKRIKVEKQPG